MILQGKKKFFLVRFFGVLLIAVFTIFLIISCATYYPYDPSLFFVTSEAVPVTNMAGALGAHCAALLFYLFGGAAFLCALPLLYIVYILLSHSSLHREWERLVIVCCFVFISAIVLATYMVDVAHSPYPGGLVGLVGAQWLLHYFDYIGRTLFLFTSIVASIIIFWRFSSMSIIRWGMVKTTEGIIFLKRYRVIQRCALCVAYVLYVLIFYPIQKFFSFIYSLYDGSAFDETDMITLSTEKKNDLSFSVDDNHEAHAPGSPIQEGEQLSCMQQVQEEQEFLHDINEAIADKRPLMSHYHVPVSDIFIYETHEKSDQELQQELHMRASILQDKLKRFGVSGEIVAIKRGPVVTLFEYQPEIDTKLSKILALEDDLAMALQAMSIRILAPIPGRSVVGFEVANHHRNDVLFSHIISTIEYKNFKGALPLILGKGTIGESIIVDLARMPHLLIAGSTGSGKSVALNSLLMSLICALSPDELKLILIDPKRLEFAAFADIAHLLFPIITSPHYAAPVLRWVVQEMELRYEKMAKKGARNCADYNAQIIDGDDEHKKLPLIVVVIDELADLMLTAGRDIEDLITRITQMARAAGIHMIVATQRPSVDVITGLIKANFPSRISFRVASRIDSRTILDAIGADRLLGRGDMLFIDASTSQLKRVHGAYVSDKEIEQVVDHIKRQQKVEYLDINKAMREMSCSTTMTEDPLYDEVCLFLQEVDEVSISLVQRKFRIGYNRSARLIDHLEAQGLIMPQDGGKTRKVIR